MGLMDRDYMREDYETRRAHRRPGLRARVLFWLWRVRTRLAAFFKRSS